MSDSAQLQQIVDDRRQLAGTVVKLAGWLIVGLSVAIVAATLAIYLSRYWDRTPDTAFTADDAIGSLQSLLSTVLPLFGAWVGAVIAFYFARENLDAAAQNTRALLREIQPDRLQSIQVSQAMIPLNRLEVVTTPTDDPQLLTDIVGRFEAKGLGRIIVMNANGTGKGVFHDGAVTRFALAQTTATPANPKATLANILADTTCKAMLDSSAVYAGESATLAKLKEDMEAKARRRRGAAETPSSLIQVRKLARSEDTSPTSI